MELQSSPEFAEGETGYTNDGGLKKSSGLAGAALTGSDWMALSELLSVSPELGVSVGDCSDGIQAAVASTSINARSITKIRELFIPTSWLIEYSMRAAHLRVP